MGKYRNLDEKRTKTNYMPIFKDAASYADRRIEVLRHDFCVNVTAEDEVYIRQFTSEHGIDSACKNVLNKHWS